MTSDSTRSKPDEIRLTTPRSDRLARDIVWLSVITVTLAGLAVVVAVVDLFLTANLVPLVQGTGLASIAFGVLGITDHMSGHR